MTITISCLSLLITTTVVCLIWCIISVFLAWYYEDRTSDNPKRDVILSERWGLSFAFSMILAIVLAIATASVGIYNSVENGKQEKIAALKESLPGGWYDLYTEIDAPQQFFILRSKLVRIFVEKHASNQPPLPASGMNLLLSRIHSDDMTEILELLSPYLLDKLEDRFKQLTPKESE